MPRLNRTVTLIVGIALIAGIAVLAFFMLLMPRLRAIAGLKKEIRSHREYAAKKPKVEQDLEEARAETVRVERQMDDIYRKKMPGISLRVPLWTMFSLWYETGPGPSWFRRSGMGPGAVGTGALLTRYFDSIGYPAQGITLSPWGLNPPDRSLRTLPPLPLTLTFRVNSLEHFLKLFEKFEGAPRFLVVQGASLSGQSPDLTAQIPVIAYAWTKDYAAAAAPAEGEAAGMGGMMGGMPGMMPGMPGMIPGMPGMMPGMPGMMPGMGGPGGAAGGGESRSTSTEGSRGRRARE